MTTDLDMNVRTAERTSMLLFVQEFLDPLNEHTALKEARHMIAVVDRDHDGFLERSELLAAGEYFTGSKFMDFLTRHEDL